MIHSLLRHSWGRRAYVVYEGGLENVPANFTDTVQHWIKDFVPSHQYLEGGVVVTDAIPRRFDHIHDASLQLPDVYLQYRGESLASNVAR
jgi:hypothetical protein